MYMCVTSSFASYVSKAKGVWYSSYCTMHLHRRCISQQVIRQCNHQKCLNHLICCKKHFILKHINLIFKEMEELSFIPTHLRNLLYLKNNTKFCSEVQKKKKNTRRGWHKLSKQIVFAWNCSLLTKINNKRCYLLHKHWPVKYQVSFLRKASYLHSENNMLSSHIFTGEEIAIVMDLFHWCLYNKQNITWLLFSWISQKWERYLAHSLGSLLRYWVEDKIHIQAQACNILYLSIHISSCEWDFFCLFCVILIFKQKMKQFKSYIPYSLLSSVFGGLAKR